MKPRLARAFLVLAVFAVLATVGATSHYLADTGQAAPPSPSAKPVGMVFWSAFRYYLAWAICAPAIFWLARKVPLVRRGWYRPAVFHLLVPVLAAVPFLTFRLLLNGALTLTSPPLAKVAAYWQLVVPMETLAAIPVYWLLLVTGTTLQVQRDTAARRVQAVQLERSLADAQLDALRTKLQPHFLFNTLNTIGSLARQEDAEAVVEMVDHLGGLLRLSMETSGRQLVTLEEEWRALEEYLAIEEVRHGDRLAVVRRLDPEALRAMVPSLILQPLVENAIAHGLGGRIDASLVEITAVRDGAGLELSVRDDGPGLPPDWTLARGAGRGLSNVLERLHALYGDGARLEVAPAPAGGTVSRLLLPFAAAPPASGARPAEGLDGGGPERRIAWTA
ncbi:MAG: hypothetical protein H6Q10_916 [Acidobacteria bacterium]|nr:hypothetical protein [Acidobacteriota bacterium]